MLEDKQNEWDWRQINAFAAQNGALLGTYGRVSLVVYAVGVRYSLVCMLGWLRVGCCPCCGAFLCVRFRETITERNAPFSFGKGYVHCLLMGIYAGILIAMGLYMWFAFFDNGVFADAFLFAASQPHSQQFLQEMQQQGGMSNLYELTGATTPQQLADAFRILPASVWASSVLSLTFFVDPIISIFIGLFTMSRGMGV